MSDGEDPITARSSSRGGVEPPGLQPESWSAAVGTGVNIGLLPGAPGAILAGLPDAELRAVGVRLRSHSYPAGATLVEQGSWKARLYILVSGLLQVSMTDPEGNALELARLLPGESAGEMSLLSGEPASATVATVEDSVVWELEGADFAELVDTCPVFSHNLARLLSKRVSHTDRELAGRFKRLMHLRLHANTPAGLPEAIAEATGWHLGLPLLVLDHRGASVWRETQCIASVEVLEAPQILGRLERRGLPGAVAVSTAGAEPAVWPQLEEWLSEHVSHVLVISDAENPPPGLSDLRSPVHAELMLSPPNLPASTTLRGDVVLVGNESGSNSVRVLERESERVGARVVRILAAAPVARRDDVNWIARHLAGLKIGLALGGGGVRGAAHLGALSALRRAAVPIDYLAGASVGAIVAGAVAHGLELTAVEQLFSTASEDLVKFTIPRHSILSNHGLIDMIRRHTEDVEIEDLPVPLAVVAVDILRGEEVVLDSGVAWEAIVASASIPGIYPPVWIGEHCLVDGGVLDPIPARAVRHLGADVVLAVGLSSPRTQDGAKVVDAGSPAHKQSPNVLDTILRTIDLMAGEIGRSVRSEAHVTISIATPNLGLRDAAESLSLLPLGEAAVRDAWPRIRDVLPWLSEWPGLGEA